MGLFTYFYLENFLERNYYRLGNSSIIHTLLLKCLLDSAMTSQLMCFLYKRVRLLVESKHCSHFLLRKKFPFLYCFQQIIYCNY